MPPLDGASISPLDGANISLLDGASISRLDGSSISPYPCSPASCHRRVAGPYIRTDGHRRRTACRPPGGQVTVKRSLNLDSSKLMEWGRTQLVPRTVKIMSTFNDQTMNNKATV